MAFPTPQGRQTDALYLPDRGHTVVLGTAGSGKTTMAILRARDLAGRPSTGQGRVLLVTFNRALVTYLNSITSELNLSNRIEVRNYHHFARGYLGHRKLLGRTDILDSEPRRLALITEAIRAVQATAPQEPIWQYPPEFFAEECRWVVGCGLSSPESYLQLRAGITTPLLTTTAAALILTVNQRYRALRQQRGYRYDWDDLADTVTLAFDQDTSPRYYRHVVIDEGQDFTPAMLRSLARAIPSDGSLTFFGDAAQQIYGSRISWRIAGLNLQNPIVEFRENYRNSREIAQLCIAMTHTPAFDGVADLVRPNQIRAEGPLPALVICQSPQAELQLAVSLARRYAVSQSVAILVRRQADVDMVRGALRPLSVQVLHHSLERWVATGISVGTIHGAKGMEFDAVIMPFCGADRIPDPEHLRPFADDTEGEAREARLLYVAMSRAKSRLVITATGQPTRLLPNDPTLYQRTQQ